MRLKFLYLLNRTYEPGNQMAKLFTVSTNYEFYIVETLWPFLSLNF